MQKNKNVAVLDFGSSKITALIGERGVNKTFVIKARKDFLYDGFADGEFLNVAELKLILKNSVDYLATFLTNGFSVYVGVPGEFTSVIVKDCQVSFPKKKKIEESDLDTLFDSAFVISSQKHTLINRSAIVYELDDFRRFVSPLGMVSEILKGKLSFVLCDNYFINLVKPLLLSLGVSSVDFVSTQLAEAMYLLDSDTRDRVAMLVDVGYITSTFTLIQGDGILYQKTFAFGGGIISAKISEKLDVDFADADELKRLINITRNYEKDYDLISLDDGKYYKASEISEEIKASLYDLCENLTYCMENCGYVIPEYVPLYITGGGVSFIRGAKQFISARMGAVTDFISPSVPLLDKPTESSVLSLLNLTFEHNAN